MKKSFLLLIVLALLIVPTVFGLENTFGDFVGNGTDIYFTIVSTNQTSVNPGIGDDVSYVTTINVTHEGESAIWNVTNFTFYLPDNASTQVLGDFKLHNDGIFVYNATVFTAASRNYVIWQTTGANLNGTNNGTWLTINWSLSSPIAQTKISVIRAGRTYTELWNITSSASNLTIVNASLNVTPSYWHTRIGNPITTFNSTSKNYFASFNDVAIYSDLNMSHSDDLTGNMIKYGSGWGTLSVVYNGPIVDSSSGSSATAGEVTPVISVDILKKIGFWLIIGLGIMILGSVIYGIVFLTKRPKY